MEAEMGRRPPDVEQSPEVDFLAQPEHGKSPDHHSVWDRFPRLGHLNRHIHSLLGKDDARRSPISVPDTHVAQLSDMCIESPQLKRDCPTRPVGVLLPRQATFRRQNSEKRDRLLPYQPCAAERRAMSVSRQTSLSLEPFLRSKSSPPHDNTARNSAPAVPQTVDFDIAPPKHEGFLRFDEEISPISLDTEPHDLAHRFRRPLSRTSSNSSLHDDFHELDDRAQLNAELDSKWILNLSMHFRDRSDREKFFVTYAESPNRWRRVTISCDYRHAEPGSLEIDLKELRFQRDKNLHIYESIRDSLSGIHFFDTVTNLKLETSDGRLHVHVTEDVNETIPYPAASTVQHIMSDEEFQPMEVLESDLIFDSHLSGFVYKVSYRGKTYIKKEIPGPDTVDEFLYEINALHALHGSQYVIQLEAIVVDDSRQLVKGLLINFAERGAIVDLLYDHKGEILWEDRVRWAEQAIRGLSEIHEEGFVQGDFTLSNIVVDGNNNAQIIDINRRGCPVGWEPPEIAKKISSNQRISMYIGEKSDLYQLGMSLWALAMNDDEPERHDPPLSTEEFPSDVPEWYQDIVRICLAERPRDRLPAKELLRLFQTHLSDEVREVDAPKSSFVCRNSQEFINPEDAVGRDDLERFSHLPEPTEDEMAHTPPSSYDDLTYTFPKSSNYEYGSTTSELERPRGRRLVRHSFGEASGFNRRFDEQPASSSYDNGKEFEPQTVSITPGGDSEYEEIEFDGHHYLVAKRDLREPGTASDIDYFDPSVRPEEEGHSSSARENGPQVALPSKPSVNRISEVESFKTESLEPPSSHNNDENMDSTSESTPRGTHAVLAESASTIASSLDLDQAAPEPQATELAMLSTRGEHISYKPKSSEFEKNSNAGDETLSEGHHLETQTKIPSMSFADSGYDEPSVFGQAEHDSKNSQIHIEGHQHTMAEAVEDRLHNEVTDHNEELETSVDGPTYPDEGIFQAKAELLDRPPNLDRPVPSWHDENELHHSLPPLPPSPILSPVDQP